MWSYETNKLMDIWLLGVKLFFRSHNTTQHNNHSVWVQVLVQGGPHLSMAIRYTASTHILGRFTATRYKESRYSMRR